MTARSLELIARADVILYDRLIPDGALAGARDDALLLDVGKVGGGEQVPQEATNALLLEHGPAGRAVVRLKGGDPFVFGRGGEEAQLLRAAGIDVEVVPGVTAGVAAPAYAGIPVTQRGMAAAVAFVTGHEDPARTRRRSTGRRSPRSPARSSSTWACASSAGSPSSSSRAGGPPTEPVAVVERGTFADQRTVTGTLADIAVRASEARVRAPAITVVGPVAALRAELAWFAAGPLPGRSVAVTRARAQASALAGRLGRSARTSSRRRRSASSRWRPRSRDLASYDLLCVTSPTALGGCSSWRATRARWPARRSRRSARARPAR